LKIAVRVKSAGKRRAGLELAEYEIRDGIDSAEALIDAFVRSSVRRYNAKVIDAPLFLYLTADELDEQARIGKIEFSDRKGEKNADEEQAVRTALEAFRDGLFLLLVGGVEVKSGGGGWPGLREGDALTFIRLTMLAGRRW
jgi:hypothetical protein